MDTQRVLVGLAGVGLGLIDCSKKELAIQREACLDKVLACRLFVMALPCRLLFGPSEIVRTPLDAHESFVVVVVPLVYEQRCFDDRAYRRHEEAEAW